MSIRAVVVPPHEVGSLAIRGAAALVGDHLMDELDDLGSYYELVVDAGAGAMIRDVVLGDNALDAARARVLDVLRSLIAATPELAGWSPAVDLAVDERDPEEEPDEDGEPDSLPTGDELAEHFQHHFRDEARLHRRAMLFRGLPIEALDPPPDHPERPTERGERLRRATLLAGCLIDAATILTDQLIEDVETLRRLRAVSSPDDLHALSALPRRYAHRYNALFAQRFLVAFTDLTARLTREWEPLACVAQELGLRLLLDEVEVIEDTISVALPEHWRGSLNDLLFEDLDHEYLFDPASDGIEDEPELGPPGMAPMGFDDWFEPFNKDRTLPPYALPDVPDEPLDGS